MDYKWPKQSEVNEFYGNPRGSGYYHASSSWQKENLVFVTPPFQMTYEGKLIKGFQFHKKCSEALLQALKNIQTSAGNDYDKLKYWKVTDFCGSYVYRLMRGGNSLSMHAYGIAIDLDAANNGFYDKTPRFAQFPEVIKAFDDVGATWGGRWTRATDGMHWQFARI